MLLLVYGVVRLEHRTDGLAVTLAVFAAGVVLLAAFVRAERRSATPLVLLGILRSSRLPAWPCSSSASTRFWRRR